VCGSVYYPVCGYRIGVYVVKNEGGGGHFFGGNLKSKTP